MSRADNYAYAIAYVRALRSRLLSEEQYETLLKAKDEQDVLRYLADTAYSSRLAGHSGKSLNLSDIDSAIFEDYYRILGELVSVHTTEKARLILETNHMRHEFSCLKFIMHLVRAGVPPEESAQLVTPVGRYTPEYVSRLLKTRNLRQLFSEVNDPKIKEIALSRVGQCEELNSTLPVEMALDKFYLNSLWATVSKLDNWDRDPVRDIIGTEIDTANMSLILRGKHLGMTFSALQDLAIPIRYKLGEETETAMEAMSAIDAMQALTSGYYGNIVSRVKAECERKRTLLPLELELKRFFAQRCSRTFVGYPFGIGPILAFLNLKYFEALDIRTILLGKRDRMPVEALRRLVLSPSTKVHDQT